MRKIPLSQAKFALVDDEDFERLIQFNWYALKQPHAKTFYAVRNGMVNNKKTPIRMHRFILEVEHGNPLVVDHKDGNGLNNQRTNLRIVTQHQNTMNQSKKSNSKQPYKGISFVIFNKKTGHGKWRARIKLNYRTINLGYFKTKEEAAAAYNLKAREFYKEFARINNVG